MSAASPRLLHPLLHPAFPPSPLPPLHASLKPHLFLSLLLSLLLFLLLLHHLRSMSQRFVHTLVQTAADALTRKATEQYGFSGVDYRVEKLDSSTGGGRRRQAVDVSINGVAISTGGAGGEERWYHVSVPTYLLHTHISMLDGYASNVVDIVDGPDGAQFQVRWFVSSQYQHWLSEMAHLRRTNAHTARCAGKDYIQFKNTYTDTPASLSPPSLSAASHTVPASAHPLTLSPSHPLTRSPAHSLTRSPYPLRMWSSRSFVRKGPRASSVRPASHVR